MNIMNPTRKSKLAALAVFWIVAQCATIAFAAHEKNWSPTLIIVGYLAIVALVCGIAWRVTTPVPTITITRDGCDPTVMKMNMTIISRDAAIDLLIESIRDDGLTREKAGELIDRLPSITAFNVGMAAMIWASSTPGARMVIERNVES